MTIEKNVCVFVEGNTVIGMPFRHYLDWASNGERYSERLCLPSIQRSFVWKPEQIVNLWDSLLRGMPVGSLLINRLEKGAMATPVDDSCNRKMQEVAPNSLGLLDGQQRSLAMLLGWPSGKDLDKCIWVDLAEDGKNGAPCELRISSFSQPFGFERHTHRRFSVGERRNAREVRFSGADKQDSDASIAKKMGLTKVRPWKGNTANDLLLYPLRDLWKAYLDHVGQPANWYESIAGLASAASDTKVKARIDRICRAFDRLNKTQIPLVLMAELEHMVGSDNQANHPLILLFERISTGGTRLTSGELLFSMIKQIWPEAHDLVEKLHRTKVKHLMTSNDFVTTAFRMAMIECIERIPTSNMEDNPEPGPQDFHKQLSIALGDNSNPGPLRKYIHEDSPLAQAFEILYDLIIFREHDDDKGIPELMMPYLQRSLIQVLVFWVMRQIRAGKSVDDLERSRNQLIAFILFWYLCAIDPKRASKQCISLILDQHVDTPFPGQKLYSVLTTTDESNRQNASMRSLVSPEDARHIMDISPSSILRSFGERINRDASVESRQLLESFWWNKSVLLWIQRKYLTEKFRGYEALAGKEDEDTVPYDYDHL